MTSRSIVFTDGSCDPNPGAGGWGWVWVEAGEIIAQGNGRNPDTTNNRMDLQALIDAFEYFLLETEAEPVKA